MTLACLVALISAVPPPIALTPRPAPTPLSQASPTPTASADPALPSSPRPEGSPTPTPTPDLAALIDEADGHFALRSFDARDDVANPHEIDEAIRLYREAVALAPRDMITLARLMRALHFKGAYTGLGLEEKKAVFDEGRKLGQAAVDRLEAEARAARGYSRIEALRLVKGAPALYLWTAAHWGEWGLARGKFSAARSGVAGKLRDLAQTVIDMDPLYEDAAGYRLLGRLHSEAPKIIFITGWVSHEKGLEYLRRAYQASPEHPVNRFFLAEGILDHEPPNRSDALHLLELCANTPPRPETVLEDRRYALRAREELARLTAPAANR